MQQIKLSFCHHVENLNASFRHLSLISTLHFFMLCCQALIVPSYGYNSNHLKTTRYTEYLSFKTRRNSSGGDSRECGYHRPKLKMTRASTGDLGCLTIVVVNGQGLCLHPENCFNSLWLWEQDMDEDNILLADTLLILQMQQELETGKRMPRRYSISLTWWLLGCMDQQYGKVNKFILEYFHH